MELDTQRKKVNNVKKRTLTVAIIVLIIIAGGAFGIIHHNNEVQAEKIAKQKEQIQKEKDILENAKLATVKAYESREKNDIDTANEAINKLADRQKENKSELNDKMIKLEAFLKQITNVNTALAKATTSKSSSDIDSAQSLIDKMTDDYLKNDKSAAQKKLNDLKEQITKEKAKIEADNKAKKGAEESVQQVQKTQTVQSPTETEQPQQTYQEPQQSYQQPETTQQAPQQNYQQQVQPQQGDVNADQNAYQDSWNKTAEMYRQAEEWRNSPEAKAEAERNGPAGHGLGEMGEWNHY